MTVVALLSGCGFHLRGQSEGVRPLPTYYLDVSNRALGSELKRQLIEAGGQTASGRQGYSVIEITGVTTKRETTTVDAEGRISGVRLVMELAFRVFNSKGLVTIERQTLHVSERLSYDHSLILQMQSKERVLENSLRQKLAEQLIKQLLRVQAAPGKVSSRLTATPALA